MTSENLSVAIEASTLKPISIAVVTSSTLIPYTGASSDALSIAKNRKFYFKVTYEDNSVKQIKSSGNLSFNCRYPYGSVKELSDNSGYFYLHTYRSGSQVSTGSATAYITASYTENGTTVSVNMYLTIYSWISSLRKSGDDMIVIYGDGATKTLENTAFYHIPFGTGNHIPGWPSSLSIANVVYFEPEQSAKAGNYYIMDGTFGIPYGRMEGTLSATSTVGIYEIR